LQSGVLFLWLHLPVKGIKWRTSIGHMGETRIVRNITTLPLLDLTWGRIPARYGLSVAVVN
jgi:hypothetical protein